jgi:hypothetical protein
VIFSIDPSSGATSALGWAAWASNELVCAGLVRGLRAKLDSKCQHYADAVKLGSHVFGSGRRAVFVEQMQMSQGRDGSGEKRTIIAKANDLLELQAVGAYVAGALGGSLCYVPVGTWKGSAPKHVTEARARAALSPAELAIVEAELARHRGGLGHNLWDAVGIGLHATGRYRLPGRAA